MRYFFHVRAQGDGATDDVGKEFVDVALARAEAIEVVREIICLKLQQGDTISRDWSIEIADAHGNIIEATPFERIVFGASVHDRHQRAFHALNHPYLLLSADFDIIDANRAYLAATLTDLEAIRHCNLFDVFPDNPSHPEADGAHNLRASLQRVLHEKRPDVMPKQRYDIRRGDGNWEERYWKIVNVPVLDEAGMLELIVHSVEDVTHAGPFVSFPAQADRPESLPT